MSSPRVLLVLALTCATGLRSHAAAGKDWPTYLGDSGATHFSTLKQITPRNVARLQPAWTFHCGDAITNNRTQIQCNPLVVDGVLYGTSPQLKLFALDAATGRELWRFDPFSVPGAERGSLGVNRGLVLWREGREQRLLLTAGFFLHAIDPSTGKIIESFGQGGRVDLRQGLDRDASHDYILGTTPGTLYRDLLIIATRVNESLPAAPGHIRAYDVRTGKRRWIFHTIPLPGEYGHDTWPPDAYQHIGGANCWAGLTVDQARGLAFVPTGSAAFDFWGGNRIGQNLFANCLLALDAATGERRWHFQVVRHDIWDRDLPAPPVLCDVKQNGRTIPAVAQTTKDGHVWVFDRATGNPLFPYAEVPALPSEVPGEVAWTNQPVPLRPPPFSRQTFTEADVTDLSPASHDAILRQLRAVKPHHPFQPPSLKGAITYPGLDGGGEWGGAAVDPNGILYVNANEMAWLLTMVPTKPEGEGPSSSGRALFTQLCAPCHGLNREGNIAQNVPTLVNVGQKMKPADIVTLLGAGKGVMPSFDFLKPTEKESLAAYALDPTSAAANAAGADAASEGPARTRVPFTITGYNRLLDPEGYPAVKPPWGTLNAIDLNKGEFVWRATLGELPELTAKGIPPTGTENYGGPVVTAGGLVFIGASKDEKFRAFDRKTGRKLWETQLPAGGYATPATYSAGGKQFVVIACGGGKMGTKSGDSYVAYALSE